MNEAQRIGQESDTRVRNILLSTRGARVCPFKPCEVITQPVRGSASAGERAHRIAVHSELWETGRDI